MAKEVFAPSCLLTFVLYYLETDLWLYMTVQGMQQHEQSSVLKQEHLPPWGLTMEPAAVEMEEAVEAGISTSSFDVQRFGRMRGIVDVD
jgi:hypothetical protein